MLLLLVMMMMIVMIVTEMVMLVVMVVTDECCDFRALRRWCMPVHLPTSLTATRQSLPTGLHSSWLDKMDLQVIVNSLQPLVTRI